MSNATHLKHLALVLGTVAIDGDRHMPILLVLVLEPQPRPQRHLRANYTTSRILSMTVLGILSLRHATMACTHYTLAPELLRILACRQEHELSNLSQLHFATLHTLPELQMQVRR